MTTHQLKTHPEQFCSVWDGRKLHEVRVNDRDFRLHDELMLHEYSPNRPDDLGGPFTGRWIRVLVTHLTPGGEWGLPPGLCVMSVVPLDKGVSW